MLVKRSLGLLAVGLVVSACGSSVQVVRSRPIILRPVPAAPTALRFSSASNRAFARRDVQKLIRMVVLPRSAERVQEVPKNAPSWFRRELNGSFPGTEFAHRTWIVTAPLKAVVRYFRTHANPRPRPVTGFGKSATRIGSRPTDNWMFTPVPGRSSNRWLNVAMLALPGGATVVTAQAGDEWIHPPPASAELPGTVKRIDITGRYGSAAPSVRIDVHSRYLVRSLVSWMNGIGVTQGHFMCAGEGFGMPITTLTFRDGRGRLVARGVFDSNGPNGCKPFSLTVNGQPTPPLTAGDLLQRIEQLLNADFSPPLPRDVSSCLGRLGWHVQTTTDGLTVRKNGPPSTITFHPTGKVTTTGPQHLAIDRCLRSSPHIIYDG